MQTRQPSRKPSALLGTNGAKRVLAGGTDLISLMKEYIHTPKRVVNIKGIKELERHSADRRRDCASAPDDHR